MKIAGLRWWIVGLVFGTAVLNYVDRQTLSALAPTIQKDLAMDDRACANVVNLFLVAYTVSYLVSGKLADKLGTRGSMNMLLGGLLASVAGTGYGQWFLLMAFLHPLAWLLLKFGGVERSVTPI